MQCPPLQLPDLPSRLSPLPDASPGCRPPPFLPHSPPTSACSRRSTSSAFLPPTGSPRFLHSSFSFTTVSELQSVPAMAAGRSGLRAQGRQEGECDEAVRAGNGQRHRSGKAGSSVQGALRSACRPQLQISCPPSTESGSSWAQGREVSGEMARGTLRTLKGVALLIGNVKETLMGAKPQEGFSQRRSRIERAFGLPQAQYRLGLRCSSVAQSRWQASTSSPSCRACGAACSFSAPHLQLHPVPNGDHAKACQSSEISSQSAQACIVGG